jgi:cell division protein FtsB
MIENQRDQIAQLTAENKQLREERDNLVDSVQKLLTLWHTEHVAWDKLLDYTKATEKR